ncbi:MAG: hypothetical protein ACTSQJ_00400 [Promethearchaeota archaeon]
MSIKYDPHKKKCTKCGKEFTTFDTEEDICWNCRKKGYTYKEINILGD